MIEPNLKKTHTLMNELTLYHGKKKTLKSSLFFATKISSVEVFQ